MAKQKRFQSQTLNSEDYEKIEEGAKAVKNGSVIFSTICLAVGIGKKYGPALLKNLRKLGKICHTCS